MNKKIYDDFARLVIERIHGLPYEEAIKREMISVEVSIAVPYGVALKEFRREILSKKCFQEFPKNSVDNTREYIYKILKYNGPPITIGRVMCAIINSGAQIECYSNIDKSCSIQITSKEIRVIWILTKENGQECTHLDQTEETILKLTKLLK